MTKNGRKLILVRTDLLEKAARITAKEGKTLFAFTNEAFERAIEAYDAEVTLAEVLEFYQMMKTGKSLNYIAIPCSILNNMAKKLYAIEREKTLNEWYESGLWNGNYLSLRFQDRNKLEVVKSFMKASMWNLDEFIVNVENDRTQVKCFSPNLDLECVEMLARFLRGVFNSLGYVVRDNKCLRGIVIMELEGEKPDRTPIKHPLQI